MLAGGARVSRSHLQRVFQLQLLFVLLKARAKHLQMLGVGGLQRLLLLLQSRRLQHRAPTDEWGTVHRALHSCKQPVPPLSGTSAGGCSAPSSALPSASPASPRNRASPSGVLLPGKVSTAEEQQWEWVYATNGRFNAALLLPALFRPVPPSPSSPPL